MQPQLGIRKRFIRSLLRVIFCHSPFMVAGAGSWNFPTRHFSLLWMRVSNWGSVVKLKCVNSWLLGKFFITCPQFLSGMSCSLANFCQLIRGGGRRKLLRSSRTFSLSHPCHVAEFRRMWFGGNYWLFCRRRAFKWLTCAWYDGMDWSSVRTAIAPVFCPTRWLWKIYWKPEKSCH